MEENTITQELNIFGTFDDIPDTLTGSNLAETIFAQGGDNLVLANAGNDTIFGGLGEDEIKAGEGNDRIFASAEDDRVFGDEGNDFARGGDGSDTLFGGLGQDTLIGDSGNDTLFGGNGSDRLIGVDTTSSNTNYGRNTIDAIGGEADSDTFVLGQENAVFYNSNSNGLGTEDYALIADFETGRDSLELVGSFGDYSFGATFISSDNTDVVLDWNSAFLNAIQAEGKIEQELGVDLGQADTTLDNIRGVAPPVVARNGAILHTAIYEAVNALSNNPSGSSLDTFPVVPEGASQEAAAVGAAYTVLSDLFVGETDSLPEGFLIEQQTAFDGQRDRSLAEINNDPIAEEAGFDFGVEIAETILLERRDDGAAEAQVPFEPGAFPLYQEETENGSVTALLPNWGEVDPFAIDSIEAFNPENLPEEDILGLPEFDSDDYAN